MSSIVKKSSHFAPKIKKRSVRKEALATPPSTQTSLEDSQVTAIDQTKNVAAHERAELISPPASQINPAEEINPTEETNGNTGNNSRIPQDASKTVKGNPLLNYSISSQRNTSTERISRGEHTVDSVDPVSKSTDLAVQDSDSESETSGNNKDKDVLKPPIPKEQFTRRRSSVVGPRRLSGINPSRRSSVSVAGTPAFTNLDSEHHVKDVPVTIDVPQAKTPRKRRSSSVSRASKRVVKGSVIAVPTVANVLREETETETETVPSTATTSNTVKSTGSSTVTTSSARATATATAIAATIAATTAISSGADYVVAIDPKTNRLRKFRVSHDVDDREVAVAPPELVTTISSISQLPRRIKKEDEELFQNITVIPSEMSMADLCKPLIQIGSVSDVFKDAEAAKTKILQRKAKRREARALARERRISYAKALRRVNNEQSGDENENENEQAQTRSLGFDELLAQQPPPPPVSTLRLALVDGQMQVDQESVVRNRNGGLNSENRRVEMENSFENLVNGHTYSNFVHTDAWTTSEMVEFYNALSTWGTDFTFIAQLFPYRTRQQIKNKFILEEKNNPEYIELALRRKLPPNFDEFCARSGSKEQLKSVEDFNREMAEIQKEHEAHMREITSERERAIKEDLEANRKREIEIRTGSKPMTKAERARIIRQNEVVVGEVKDVKRTRDLNPDDWSGNW